MTDEELIAHLRLQGLDKDIAAADRIEELVKERDISSKALAQALIGLRAIRDEAEYDTFYSITCGVLDQLEKTE